MTKTEKIWMVILLLTVAVIVMIEVRSARNAALAIQGQFGGPQSTNAIPDGQQTGPQGEANIAADIGPWYIYYNTPGIYAFGPPLVNTSLPPNAGSGNSQVSAQTSQGCSTCH